MTISHNHGPRRSADVDGGAFGAGPLAGVSFPTATMHDTTSDTTGLATLLDEVERDLEELRKKHANDFGVKTTTMWWELERERLLARHPPNGVVEQLPRAKSLKRLLLVFSAGWVAMLVIDTAIRLLWR